MFCMSSFAHEISLLFVIIYSSFWKWYSWKAVPNILGTKAQQSVSVDILLYSSYHLDSAIFTFFTVCVFVVLVRHFLWSQRETCRVYSHLGLLAIQGGLYGCFAFCWCGGLNSKAWVLWRCSVGHTVKSLAKRYSQPKPTPNKLHNQNYAWIAKWLLPTQANSKENPCQREKNHPKSTALFQIFLYQISKPAHSSFNLFLFSPVAHVTLCLYFLHLSLCSIFRVAAATCC